MNYLRSFSSPCVLFDSKDIIVAHKTAVKLSYEIYSQNSYFALSSGMNKFHQLFI